MIIVRRQQRVVSHHFVAKWFRRPRFSRVKSVGVDFVINCEGMFPLGAFCTIQFGVTGVLQQNESKNENCVACHRNLQVSAIAEA